ncbi:tyrosine-type recombinase/integrase [Asaccharospora irregularis]|uniref:Phage integrase, N-terminal SAM-like domain n=1 Tax=Asaccharospora irregularis DSM 2635 TaxID=1121321 RepID=A0A1M5TRQ2_9FIRM|nr:tyrosine-type recombinase/integrase [Asaccharospora irregularis]SHH53447.1 Phage integrase, N-terminal SAM-like domain [Asaccharospora irregularis DSM 2635]
MIEGFKNFLRVNGASEATIKSYALKIEEYIRWYKGSFDLEFRRLYRENATDYLAYLRTIKRDSAKTINTKVSALISLNQFLINLGVQNDFVVDKKDRIKVQEQIISPTKVNKADVEQFRQRLLEEEGSRYYCIATIGMFCGLRIFEILSIQLSDFNFTTRELIVNRGKGNKIRIVYMNEKVVNSIKEYLKERKSDSTYLFPSEKSATGKMHPSAVNKVFNKYSKIITPHQLRHYCATSMITSDTARFAIHEAAAILGHSSVQTTLRYCNISKNELLDKIDRL